MRAGRQIRCGLEKRSDFIPAGGSKLSSIDAPGAPGALDLESGGSFGHQSASQT